MPITFGKGEPMSKSSPAFNTLLSNLQHAVTTIPHKHRAIENELMLSKWPAYRFMSPMAATRLFHKAYVEGYKEQHRITMDRDEADKLKIGGKLDYTKNNTHLTQVWCARQLADELGMPYPAYLEFCFDFASRRKRNNPPQPNQLGPSKKSADAWWALMDEYWTNERCRVELARMDPLPEYYVGFDRDLPAQNEFRRELLDIGADTDTLLGPFIASWVVVLNQLSELECAPLGDEAVARAVKDAHDEIESGMREVFVYPPFSPKEMRQACFGLPGVGTTTSEICEFCAQKKDCAIVRNFITGKVVKATGFEDPIGEKVRASQRTRTARCRSNKKEPAREEELSSG